MSPSETNSNSNFVETKQDDLDLSKMMQDSSNAELIDNPQAQQNKLSGLLKRSIKDFPMWPAEKQILAVSAAGGLLATALPLLLAAAPLIATGAMIGLALFFSVKAVQYGYKGLKWSAEKTVERAKHIGGKIKDSAVYVKDKVGESYENSVDSLKRGASFVGEGVANKFHKAAGKEDYLDKIKRFTKEEIEKSDKIRDDLKEIFADKGNNAGLIKDILSGISSKIDSKIREKTESGQIDQTFERLLEQGKFINGLSKESLHSLLTQRSLPKDTYLIDNIFSEHHDEIMKIAKECVTDHKTSNSVGNLNRIAGKYGTKKGSMQSVDSSLENSLSGSSSMDSLSTDSTVSSEAELLNPSERKKANATSSPRNKLRSWLGGKAAPGEATYISYKDSQLDEQSADIGNSRFYVAQEKPPRSNSMGSISTDSTVTTSSFTSYRRNSDSGFNSPSSSTPQRHSPSQETRFGLGVTEELTEKLAKRRAIVDQPNVESVQQKAEPSKR
ncbi:hypothetical protein Wcon_00511 [Wolbachia endosymbiont of Cylisticus convexus]|uniref:actin-bundling T4SS effector WalE1 family protein n=1 Tax=Wolbachia endosymbiont of Cylisticus convexus TaxID=118728 RepID=UPI000E18B4E7|nr:hypothetical protein [Wolbachia endosymbiont of Cylisticus convexus]RDD35329.1 hypothetical protein Wcon_00511 [Wolbachia endosymbiont of Cylisticus convexus]